MFAADLSRDLKHGARMLRRNPGFTTVAVLTLTIAIGATLTVFSIVDAWLLRPLAFPDGDRLVIAFAARPERPMEPAVWLPYRAYPAWKEQARSLSSISAAFVRDVLIANGADARTLLGLNVSAEFFRTFGVSPLAGRTLSDADATGPHVVVLSYGLWQRQFGGSPGAIGATIALSGVPHEVIGVMPADFETRVLDMRFEFWTPFRPDQKGYDRDGIGPATVIGRLNDGITIDAARTELAAISREVESKYATNFNAFVVNLTSLQADNTRTVRATLLTVAAAVLSLFLIAALNVATLVLGRGLGRIRETAIRAALGSGRGRLIRQFLAEGLLVAAAGAIGGLALAAGAMRLFTAWNPLGTLPATAIQLDGRVVAAAVVAMAVTTIVCGLLPALRGSTADPVEALRTGGERGPAAAPAQRAQTAMLIAQMAACVVLLVATTLLIRTFARLQAEPLGFDPVNLAVANVIVPADAFDTAGKRNVYYRQLIERLRALPEVRAVAASTSRPLNSGPPVTVHTTAADDPNAPRISQQTVTADFFNTYGVAMLAGRPFDDRDTADGARVVILNARAAQNLFGVTAGAIGRRVRIDKEWRDIVGVAGNVRSTFFNTLEWQTDPIVYRPATQGLATLPNPTATTFGLQLYVRSDRSLTLADIREAARSIHSGAAVTELQPVPEAIAVATRQPAFRMTLLSWFAALTLLLAAVGVYGLVSQAVTQRVREIAIRLAIGAHPSRVIGTIARRAVVIGAIGLATGAAAAFLLGSTLQALLYGVQPRDAMSFLAAGVALLTTTAVAAIVPALRITRVDPAKALRAD